MTPPQESVPDDLIAEARGRAQALRESGELPHDIDDRLADDYTRAVRRDVDRSPVDPRAAIGALRDNPELATSRIAIGDPAPRRPATNLLARLLRRFRNRLPVPLRRESRHQLADVLELMAAEAERVGRLADDAVATADMLADRVTQLERQLAVVHETPSGADRPDVPHD